MRLLAEKVVSLEEPDNVGSTGGVTFLRGFNAGFALLDSHFEGWGWHLAWIFLPLC